MTLQGMLDEAEVSRVESMLERAAEAFGTAQGEVQRAEAQAQSVAATGTQAYVPDGRARAHQALAAAQGELSAAEGEAQRLLSQIDGAISSSRSDASVLDPLARNGNSAGRPAYASALYARLEDTRRLEGFMARLRQALARAAKAGSGVAAGSGLGGSLSAGPRGTRPAAQSGYGMGVSPYLSRGAYRTGPRVDSLLRSTPHGSRSVSGSYPPAPYGFRPATHAASANAGYSAPGTGREPMLGGGRGPGGSWLEKLVGYAPLRSAGSAAVDRGGRGRIGNIFPTYSSGSALESSVAEAYGTIAPLAQRSAEAVRSVTSTLGRYIGSAVYGRNGLAGLLSRLKR